MDTIDIEDFANAVKNSFVNFFSNLLYTNLVAALPWMAAPVLSSTMQWIITQAVTFAATKGGLVLFMINTNIFTQDQAKDYMSAIQKLNNMPEGVPDEEWAKLEMEANHAFGNLIRFSA